MTTTTSPPKKKTFPPFQFLVSRSAFHFSFRVLARSFWNRLSWFLGCSLAREQRRTNPKRVDENRRRWRRRRRAARRRRRATRSSSATASDRRQRHRRRRSRRLLAWPPAPPPSFTRCGPFKLFGASHKLDASYTEDAICRNQWKPRGRTRYDVIAHQLETTAAVAQFLGFFLPLSQHLTKKSEGWTSLESSLASSRESFCKKFPHSCSFFTSFSSSSSLCRWRDQYTAPIEWMKENRKTKHGCQKKRRLIVGDTFRSIQRLIG